MQLGIVGLGKMGMNMTRRLLKGRYCQRSYKKSYKKIRLLTIFFSYKLMIILIVFK